MLLLEKFSVEELWRKNKDEILEIIGVSRRKIAEKIVNEKDNVKILEKYNYIMQKNNINLVSIDSKKYPFKLRYIDNSPAFLFYIGNLELANSNNFAIVGTRNPTEYGRNLSRKFAYEIANKNVNVASGLAMRN